MGAGVDGAVAGGLGPLAWLKSPLHAAITQLAEVVQQATSAPVVAIQVDGLAFDDSVPSHHVRVSPGSSASALSSDAVPDAGPANAIDWTALGSCVAAWPGRPEGLLARLRGVRLPQGLFVGEEAETLTGVAAADALGGATGSGATPSRHAMPWRPALMAVMLLDLPGHTQAAVATLYDGTASPSVVRHRLQPLLAPAGDRLRRAYHEQALRLLPRRTATLDPRTLQSRVGRLSATERRVLAHLLSEEGTEREIARALYRSPHTVHVHVKSIYRKLGVSSRRELQRLLAGWQSALDILAEGASG